MATLGLAWKLRVQAESITLKKGFFFMENKERQDVKCLVLLSHTHASGPVAEECGYLPPNGFVASV